MNASMELFLDSFWDILLPGLLVTIPLTALSFTFALIIAVIVALIQFANVPILTQLARFIFGLFAARHFWFNSLSFFTAYLTLVF